MERNFYTVSLQYICKVIMQCGIINTLSQRSGAGIDNHIVDNLINKRLVCKIMLQLTLLKRSGTFGNSNAGIGL